MSESLREEPQWKLVGDRLDYSTDATGGVRYAPAQTQDGRVLGYLWVADDDAAIGFEPAVDAGTSGSQASFGWYRRLRESKQSGLAPSQAFLALADEHGDVTGALRLEQTSHAETVDVVRSLAAR